MKILSLDTIKTTPSGYELKGDITLFFEFTDEQYERLINTDDFDDIWEVLDALLAWSEEYWNLDAYSKDERLKPSTTIYELTTQTNIHFLQNDLAE